MTVTTAGAATVGERYWRDSLHDFEAMIARTGDAEASGPARFKPYRGRPRHPLGEIPYVLGAVRGSRSREWTGGVEGLSALLYYTGGLTRTELGPAARWPYHRAVPSARCLFPTEVYCCIPGGSSIPAGVYAYDPAHHALVSLRQGDHRAVLAEATGADLSGARLVLVLTSIFWRTAFRYGDYAYRLCTQEAGLTAGNALLVAGVLGLRGRIHHRFRDESIARLLGLRRSRESAMSVVALYGSAVPDLAPAKACPPGPDLDEPGPDLEDPQPEAEKATAIDVRRCAALLEMDAASTAVVNPAARPPGTLASPAPRLLGGLENPAARLPGALDDPAPRLSPGPELAHALRRRQSGAPMFIPTLRPVARSTVDRILRHVLEPHASDAVPDGCPPPITCHLWAITVTGLTAGIYRLADGALEPVAGATPQAGATPAPNVYYRTANAVAFLTGDRAAALEAFGDRSFRILNQEAGVVAQRICVMSAAEGLAARIHNGYSAAAVARMMRLPAGHEPLFQIVIGTAAPCERYLMPIGMPTSRPTSAGPVGHADEGE